MRNFRLLFLFLFALIIVHVPSLAAHADEVSYVKNVFETMSAQSGKPINHQQLIQQVEKYYDFSGLFKRVSQDFSNQLTPAQYKKINELFIQLMTSTITKRSSQLAGKKMDQVRYSLKKDDEKKSVVFLTGKNNQNEVHMEFTVIPWNQEFKIIDIAIDSALLSRNYRGQFNRIFRVEGAEGLIQRLNQKLAAMN